MTASTLSESVAIWSAVCCWLLTLFKISSRLSRVATTSRIEDRTSRWLWMTAKCKTLWNNTHETPRNIKTNLTNQAKPSQSNKQTLNCFWVTTNQTCHVETHQRVVLWVTKRQCQGSLISMIVANKPFLMLLMIFLLQILTTHTFLSVNKLNNKKMAYVSPLSSLVEVKCLCLSKRVLTSPVMEYSCIAAAIWWALSDFIAGRKITFLIRYRKRIRLQQTCHIAGRVAIIIIQNFALK